MKISLLLKTLLLFTLFISACSDETKQTNKNKVDDVSAFHQALFTLDSHVDISREYMREAAFDPGLDTAMKVDFKKMRAGGLDAVFFIVYVAQKKRDEAGYQAAYQAAKKKFDAIHIMTDIKYPDQIELARSPQDVKKILAKNKLVAMIGVENGFTIGKDISRIDEFYGLGASYIGLTHSGHNDICDSSGISKSLGDKVEEHGGLSEFGKQVVVRMNQLGMMIDVSHSADKCVEQVLEISKAPIIASHSGTRALLDHPRNLTDELIKAIADKGGVVQLVGYSGFIKNDPKRSEAYNEMKKAIAVVFKAEKFEYKFHEHTHEFADGMKQLNIDYPLASVKQFVDQIEHAIKIAGIDHVGISSDFDGGGELSGWTDASESENLTRELLSRGYSKVEIEKIWGGNLLRVWGEIIALKQ